MIYTYTVIHFNINNIIIKKYTYYIIVNLIDLITYNISYNLYMNLYYNKLYDLKYIIIFFFLHTYVPFFTA